MRLKYALPLLLAGSLLLTLPASAPAQTTVQSFDANRNLVSSGPPAKPPTVPGGKKGVDATATIIDGTHAPVVTASRKGVFQRIGIKHDHTVDVTVQYPATSAGRSIVAEALDGGQVIANARKLTVAENGTITFKFRVGHEVGAYSVALRDGTEELGLQFWVLDEQRPERNPPVVNPRK
jgi:hypothetical protein